MTYIMHSLITFTFNLHVIAQLRVKLTDPTTHFILLPDFINYNLQKLVLVLNIIVVRHKIILITLHLNTEIKLILLSL